VANCGDQLKNVFDDLHNSPLQTFILIKNQIDNTYVNSDWDMDAIFREPNVNITHFAIDNAFKLSFKGRLSKRLPSLEYLSLSLPMNTDDVAITYGDAMGYMPRIRTLRMYGYPSKIKPFHEGFPVYLTAALFRFQFFENCFDNIAIRASSNITTMMGNNPVIDLSLAFEGNSTRTQQTLNSTVVKYCINDRNTLDHVLRIEVCARVGIQQAWK
jgi:hypothetical protein